MMLETGQLAVVIPVHNDADNLRHCLSALIEARGTRPVKILVVDDASSDSTPDVIREFEVEHIRSDENRGQSWARNHGTRLANCKHILFVDSDVTVRKDCFLKIGAFLAEDKPDEVLGLQGYFSIEHPHAAWSSLIYNAWNHLHYRTKGRHAAVNTSFFLIRQETFDRLGGFREDMWFLEDTEFGRRMARAGYCTEHGTISFVHRKHVTWRWMFRSAYLGGKMLRVLSQMRPTSSCQTADREGKTSGGRLLCGWLVTGPLLLGFLAVALLWFRAGWGMLALGLAAIVLWAFLRSCRPLWKVKRNPVFFGVGCLTYLLLPWFISCGRFAAVFSDVQDHERRSWMRRKSPLSRTDA